MTRELRCTAGHLMGVPQEVDGSDLVLLIRHGRAFLVDLAGIRAIQCECHAWWLPDPSGLPLAGLEYKAPSLAGRT